MGWNNPPIPWHEFERRLSDRPAPQPAPAEPESPRSRRRHPKVPDLVPPPPGPVVPYAELHCHSNFSFLDGAAHPEELATQAAALGLEALALTDHDGLYGVVRFAEAAEAAGVATLFGAELSLGLAAPQNGVADPEGAHLLVLARDPAGYARLSRAISAGQFAGNEKGRPVYDLEDLAGAADGRWAVLTGCRKGLVPAALARGGPEAAGVELGRLAALFGHDNVLVELWDHGHPLDTVRNDALSVMAQRAGLPTVATNNVHYATPSQGRLAAAMAAIRARRSLDEMDGWLPPAGAAHLRSGAEMARRFARYRGIMDRTVELARQCAFPLDLIKPRLPRFEVPHGYTEMTYLRALTGTGALHRYGTREQAPRAHAQIEHELRVIEEQGFPGYFLIVWKIVQYCRENNILCQGRGSAANSAVCYALGITSVDAVEHKLLFERFLSTERDGPPDIDLDIESDRREDVIQYVYRTYGRDRAAQVANVITYRGKSAIRDAAKALGHSPGQIDAWSKQVGSYEDVTGDHDVPDQVVELAGQLRGFPRHLGIHSGGMVLCDRPVVDVCPVEWARMADRSVLQWDKDDCASAHLVKFDLLGLGMLSALHYAFDMLAEFYGKQYDLASIPQEDPAVYDMLCRADSVGVFQVESRAQMATLPRLKPRKFYDLVVEVAIIRPGPIQGGSVHPYIRRLNRKEKVTYLHDLLRPALEKTLGVPLFQEQLMQIAIDVAGFSPAESDQLRQAMSSKRSPERLARLRPRLLSGMAERGIGPEVADQIYEKLIAFADFGFPESHAMSFAYLVYASAWIKLHYPAVFCAALLAAQPMGFYSPQSLVADARRHGVRVLGPDVNASAAKATLQRQPDGSCAVRLGLSSVRQVGEKLAERIAEGRPYAGMGDLTHRMGLTVPTTEALATSGAFGCFDCYGPDRRAALWAAGAVARDTPDHLFSELPGSLAPPLPTLTGEERAIADLWATGVSPDSYPTEFLRQDLNDRGVVSAAGLRRVPSGTRVLVAGVVTHRQRPSTAGGVTFLNLEDETGFVNIICSPGAWKRYSRVGREAPAMLVRGRVESTEGVINVLAERLAPLRMAAPSRSRDFH